MSDITVSEPIRRQKNYELLAEMLGVRRTSVTEVARRMQDQGIITYTRGVITILDRPGLEKLSCECYQTLLEHEATLTN